MTKFSKKRFYNFIILGLTLTLIIIAIIIIATKDNTASNKDIPSTSDTSVTNEVIQTATTTTTTTEKVKDRFDGLKLTINTIGVPVLYYHSINEPETNEVTLSKEKLREQLKFVKDSGYTTLTISELNSYIKNDIPIPEKSIVITFDDGYMDNYTNAFTILKELDMKATIFVITSGIDDGYYLSSSQIKELANYGIDIQSHTVNHVHLDTLSYDKQLDELSKSKKQLESLTGKAVISIAYPFGSYNPDSEKAAKDAGYSLAFTTSLGLSKRSKTSYSLNRIYVSSTFTMDTFKERLLNTK